MRLFGSWPPATASMMAWKFEPKPEAMTRMRHGDASDPDIFASECGEIAH